MADPAPAVRPPEVPAAPRLHHVASHSLGYAADFLVGVGADNKVLVGRKDKKMLQLLQVKDSAYCEVWEKVCPPGVKWDDRKYIVNSSITTRDYHGRDPTRCFDMEMNTLHEQQVGKDRWLVGCLAPHVQVYAEKIERDSYQLVLDSGQRLTPPAGSRWHGALSVCQHAPTGWYAVCEQRTASLDVLDAAGRHQRHVTLEYTPGPWEAIVSTETHVIVREDDTAVLHVHTWRGEEVATVNLSKILKLDEGERVISLGVCDGRTLHVAVGRGWVLSLHTLHVEPLTIAETQFFSAAEKGDVERVRRLLSDQPDLVRAENANGQTAVHLAARGENADMLAALIDLGADVNAQDKDGRTPLHHTAESGNEACVARLLSANADVSIKDKAGRTAWDLAVENQHSQITELLLKAGDVPRRSTARPSKGLGPEALKEMAHNLESESLILAAKDEDLEQLSDILEMGHIDPNAQDDHGKSVLHHLIGSHLDYVKADWILENNVNVNIRDSSGDTPLHLCVRNNSTKVAKRLLQHGANKTIPNKKGKKPIDVRPCSDAMKRLLTGTVEPRRKVFVREENMTTTTDEEIFRSETAVNFKSKMIAEVLEKENFDKETAQYIGNIVSAHKSGGKVGMSFNCNAELIEKVREIQVTDFKPRYLSVIPSGKAPNQNAPGEDAIMRMVSKFNSNLSKPEKMTSLKDFHFKIESLLEEDQDKKYHHTHCIALCGHACEKNNDLYIANNHENTFKNLSKFLKSMIEEYKCVNELLFIYSRCHGDNTWENTLSMLVYSIEPEQEHAVRLPDRRYIVLIAPVAPVGSGKEMYNHDRDKRDHESRSFLKLVGQLEKEAIHEVTYYEQILPIMKKFIEHCKANNVKPSIVFNGHGASDGSFQLFTGDIDLRPILEHLKNDYKRKCLFDVEIILGQCYGHLLRDVSADGFTVVHLTSDVKKETRSVFWKNNDDSFINAYHIELNMYAKAVTNQSRKPGIAKVQSKEILVKQMSYGVSGYSNRPKESLDKGELETTQVVLRNVNENSKSKYKEAQHTGASNWATLDTVLHDAYFEGLTPKEHSCHSCGNEATIMCPDCAYGLMFCSACFDRSHENLLFHLPLLWQGHCYVEGNVARNPLKRKDGHKCISTYCKEMVVYDDKGRKHNMPLMFCDCEKEAATLVRHRLWPASPVKTNVAFSFGLLELIHTWRIECQSSLFSICETLKQLHKRGPLTLQDNDLYGALTLESFEQYVSFSSKLTAS